MNLVLLGIGAVGIFFVMRTAALHGFWRVAISAFIAWLVFTYWQGESFEDKTARLAKPPDPPHEATGCSASRRAVEARLKSPSSAKWGDCFSTTAGGVQTVRLSVDSQNAMGAMLRSQWITTVRNNVVESVAQAK